MKFKIVSVSIVIKLPLPVYTLKYMKIKKLHSHFFHLCLIRNAHLHQFGSPVQVCIFLSLSLIFFSFYHASLYFCPCH